MSLAITHKAPRNLAHQTVTPKLAEALRLMVHNGKRIDHAAQSVGLTTKRIRDALDLPHVQAFVRRERKVRLEGVLLGNITALERIREGDGAAAVSAIKLLEEMGNPLSHVAGTVAASTPGVTINIVNALPANPGQVDERQPVTIEGDQASSLVEPSPSGEQSAQ
jgi:hypothetical protein